MRREFMKSDHHTKSGEQPPVEFEIPRDYDENKTSPTTAKNTVDKKTQPPEEEPQAQEEPPQQPTPEEEQPETMETPAEVPKPPKGSRELRNLGSELDGPAWTCRQDHGRRLRVRTTGMHESWNNVIDIQEEEETKTKEERLEQRD